MDSPVAGEHLPNAELVPKGTTSAEKRKYEKLVKSKTTVTEFENIPLPGFTLLSQHRISWNSKEVLWHVIDPRGFCSSITSKNLQEILSITGITEGLIQEKCVWARQDSNTTLSLIPVNSPEYQEAYRNTEILENKPKRSEIKPGNKVLLQNGLEGIFVGKLSLHLALQPKYNLDLKKSFGTPTSMPKREVVMVNPGQFYYSSNAKIVKVLDDNILVDQVKIIDQINKDIKVPNNFFSNNHYEFNSSNVKPYQSYHNRVCAVTRDNSNIKLKITEISKDETLMLITEAYKEVDDFKVILEKSNGSQYIVHADYYNKVVNKDRLQVGQIDKLNSEYPEHIGVVNQDNGYYYNRQKKTYESIDSFCKFYKIEKIVDNYCYV